MKKAIQTLLCIGAALLICACGQSDTSGQPGVDVAYSGPIMIWNLSQFELEELHTHSNRGFHRVENKLTTPLQPDEVTTVNWSATQYISVVRKKTEGGFDLGLTTQTAPLFDQPHSVLIGFDDGLRALIGRDEAESTPGFPGFPEEIENYQPPAPENQPY